MKTRLFPMIFGTLLLACFATQATAQGTNTGPGIQNPGPIDILGEIGVIGSYRMNELGPISHSSETEFIYGECYCPILEDSADDCVKNDREKLNESASKPHKAKSQIAMARLPRESSASVIRRSNVAPANATFHR